MARLEGGLLRLTLCISAELRISHSTGKHLLAPAFEFPYGLGQELGQC